MSLKLPEKIKKRDGRIVDFDIIRISTAIFKAMEASGQPNKKAAKELADKVIEKLVKKHKKSAKFIPAIEEIQDLVEEVLIEDYRKNNPNKFNSLISSLMHALEVQKLRELLKQPYSWGHEIASNRVHL